MSRLKIEDVVPHGSWKRPKTRYRRMLAAGINPNRAKECASNGRGPWWNSEKLHMSELVPKKSIVEMGL